MTTYGLRLGVPRRTDGDVSGVVKTGRGCRRLVRGVRFVHI